MLVPADLRELEDGTRAPDPLAQDHEGVTRRDGSPPAVSRAVRGSAPAPSPFRVRCACGRSHSSDEWDMLELVGLQPVTAEADEPAMLLELRNCRCGSTISVDLCESQDVSAAEVATIAHVLRVLARAETAGDDQLVARLRDQLIARRGSDVRAD